jgi:hypothetical protein
MHKCVNKSIGNVYHLEQLVGNFFPYSQKQLGFDQPVTIVFQSDKSNSMKMLGKTAYYDPAAHEVYLYVDGRHPKDVMRSLSHELVHHAQNCRGEFSVDDETGPGYAQTNPHMRKMEREAYTKGNLIFRDFEDLIKTDKITIDIDFKKSGEPKMSLKEALYQTTSGQQVELSAAQARQMGIHGAEEEPEEEQPQHQSQHRPDPEPEHKKWPQSQGLRGDPDARKKMGADRNLLMRGGPEEVIRFAGEAYHAKTGKFLGRTDRLDLEAECPDGLRGCEHADKIIASHKKNSNPRRRGVDETAEIADKKSGEPKMSLKEWKDNELNTLLMKKWGLFQEAKDPVTTPLNEDDEAKESENYGKDESADKDEEDRLERHLDAIEHHLKALRDDMEFDEKHIDESTDEESEITEDVDLSGPNYKGRGSKAHADEKGNRPSMGKKLDLKKEAESPEEAKIKADKEKAIASGEDPVVAATAARRGQVHDVVPDVVPAKKPHRARPPSRRTGAARRGQGAAGRAGHAGVRFEGKDKKMISVTEATKLTRKIIERYLKEGK